MTEFSDQFAANPNAAAQVSQIQNQAVIDGDIATASPALATENLANQVQTESQRRVNNSGENTPQPEKDFSFWNVNALTNGENKLAPVVEPTLAEKKAAILEKIQRVKDLSKAGTSEEAQNLRAGAQSVGVFGETDAIARANTEAVFDTSTVTGTIGNVGLRALKSFTDIVDEDIIGSGDVNNIDQQNAGHVRQLENESERTSQRFVEAQQDYDNGDELSAAWKGMGALVDMGGIMGRSLWDNPGQVLDMLADSASFFVGGAGAYGKAFAAARDVSYGLRAAKTAVLEYERVHGEAPTGEALGRILMASGASAIVARASSMVLRGEGGAILKRPVNAVMNATSNATKAAVQKTLSGVASRRVANGLIDTTRLAGAFSRDALLEGAEEVAQEYLETNVSQDKDIDANDARRLAEAGVGGFAMGGVLGAPRAAVEVAGTVKAAAKSNSSLDLQDARVRSLLKRSTKAEGLTADGRQALYAEAKSEQAKADKVAEQIETSTTELEAKLAMYTTPKSAEDTSADESNRAQYNELQDGVSTLTAQIKEATDAEATSVSIDGAGEVSLTTANARLTNMQSQLDALPEPPVEVSPESQREQQIIGLLTPKQKDKAITVLTNAIAKNRNSLKQYERTKAAAQQIATRFDLTEEQRITEDNVAAEKVVERKAKEKEKAEFEAAKKAAVLAGEPVPNKSFSPYQVDSGSQFAQNTKATPEEEAQLKESIGTGNHVRPLDSASAPAWDSRKAGEDTNTAFGRLLGEYSALPEEQAEARQAVVMKLVLMTDSENAQAVNAFATPADAVAAVNAMAGIVDHFTTGNTENVMSPADFEAVVNSSPEADKATLAKGIYNSLASGAEEKLHDFMVNATPEQLKVIGAQLSPEALEHLLSQGELHKAIAENAKNVESVNEEIVNTGFDGEGHTGEKKSVTQHDAAIQSALNAGDQIAARKAFVDFAAWASEHVTRRTEWINILKKKGYADDQAEKLNMTAAERKLFPYASSTDFYVTLLAEDAIFRQTLSSGYAALENKTGITEWWADSLESNHADDAHIQAANNKAEDANYDMLNMVAEAGDAEVDGNGDKLGWDKLSAGQKAHVRGSRNWFSYFGSFSKGGLGNSLVQLFAKTNNLIARTLTNLDINQLAGVKLHGDNGFMSSEQSESWSSFLDFHGDFASTWNEHIKAGTNNKDLISNLYSSNGKDMDPNVQSILATVAYDYIATQGVSTLTTSAEDMDKMFGTQYANISQADRQKMLRDIQGKGIPRTALMRELGLAATRNLGIKLNHEGAPTDADLDLATALGHAMLNTLTEQGVLKQSKILKKNHSGFGSAIQAAEVTLVAVDTTKGTNKPSQKIAHMVKTYKKDGNILSMLGGEFSRAKRAYTEESQLPNHTKTVKGENTLSTEQNGEPGTKEAIDAMNAVPRTFKSSWLSLIENLSIETLMELDGFTTGVGVLNIDERMNVEGKNNQIESNIDDLLEHVAIVKDGTWYVNHTVVANQRTNIEGYGDYQKNKWVRMAMQNSDNGTDTITLADEAQMQAMYATLTTYMKGSDAQRTIDGNSEPELTMQSATPDMRKEAVESAINSLVDAGVFVLMDTALSGPLNTREQRELITALKSFESEFKAESGAELLELVRGLHELHTAQNSTSPTFETSFSGEADGTSNGVFFTLVQMGVFENIEEAASQLKRYGLEIKGFTGTDADIARDIYQYIGSERQAARKLATATEVGATDDEQHMAQLFAEAQEAMDSFIGAADSRNTNKPHTMTTIYSMAIQGQFAEIAKLLQKDITSELSAIANIEGDLQRVEAMEDLTRRANKILRVVASDIAGYDDVPVHKLFSGLPEDTTKWTAEQLRESSMTHAAANKMEHYAKTIEGPFLQHALETVFGKFNEKSASLNSIANNIFEVSEQARAMLTTDALDRALAAADITEAEKAAGDLPQKYTDEINARLKSLNLSAQMPSAQSVLGDYDTYLQLGTSDVTINHRSKHIQGDGLVEKRDSISGLNRELAGPGAGTGAIATHALDALGMMKRMATGMMGVHDALVGTALKLAAQSKEYNKFYMSALVKYSHINAASTQLNEMLRSVEQLSISFNPTADSEPDLTQMTMLYKKVLNGAYKNQKDVINGMNYHQLKNAVNSYSRQLDAAVAKQKAITEQIMSAATELNQMSMSDDTGYKVATAVKDMQDLADLAPDKYVDIPFLDTGVSVTLQEVIKQELDVTTQWLAESRPDSSKADTFEESVIAEVETERQWLADLSREMAKIFSPNHMVSELRKNREFSVVDNVNTVLEAAYSNLTVLVTPERAQELIDTITERLYSVAEQDDATPTYARFARTLDSSGTAESQSEYTETELTRRAEEQYNLIKEAKAELAAIDKIKEGNVVPESYATTGAMRVFADMLGDITNKMTIGEMFNQDPELAADMSSMASALSKKARARLPAHTRKALETIAASGSGLFIQVGGKNYEDANGKVFRNENTELATKPFVIVGNTIHIAPPSFKHSPFNNPANMTRLAAALQIDTLMRGDADLRDPRLVQYVTDLSRALDESEIPTTNVTGWLREIMRSYLTDVEYAQQFEHIDFQAGRVGLSQLAKALGVRFTISKLGANTEIKPDVVVWREEDAAVEDNIKDAEVGNNPSPTAQGSIAGENPIPAAKFDEIEGASLAETVTMLGETFGAEPDEHANHLTRLMDTMGQAIGKLQLGIAAAVGKVQQGQYDNGRISLHVFDSKNAPATSKLIASGHIQGAQEIFVHEVTHAATGFALENSPALYNEASALWQEVRDAKNADGSPLFDYTMFMPEGMDANSGKQADVDMANFVKKQMFDHIFEIKIGANGKSNHVAEFIAYGNTNARFRAALAQYEANVKLAPNADVNTNFLAKLGSLFGKVVNFITRKADTSDAKLLTRFDSLTARLAANDAKSKGALMHAADFTANGAGKVFSLAATAVTKTMAAVGTGLTAVPIDLVSNSGKLINQVASGNMAGIMDGLDKAYDHVNKANHNWLSSMVSESLGRRKYELTTRRDIRRITAASDAMRQNIQDSIASAINSSFAKPLEDWEMSDQRAMTDILLRADLTTLAYTGNNINSLNMDLVQELLTNPSKVDTQIADLTKELMTVSGMTPAKQAFYVRNARALGAFMATGKVVDDLLLNNASAIALEHGTTNAKTASKENLADSRKAISIIDQLASLNALHFSPLESRNRVAAIVKAEPHGTAMLMSSHFANKNDSRDTQFKDAPTLMLKGYLPDSTAKNVELRLAPVKDAELYLAQGWKVNAQLVRDTKDHVNTDMQYYTRRTIGTVYNKGGFDLTTMAARGLTGTKISTMSPAEASALGVKNAQAVAQRSQTVNRMYRPLGTNTISDIDIMSGKVPNRMAPSLDGQGNISEYRYLIPNTIKDSVLMREVNPANVMAKAHGQTKQRSGLVTNTTPLVTTLKRVYDNLSESKKDTTVEISAHSTDARGLEAYRMLPAYIKDEIRDVWGSDKMHVPAAMMDPVFGNRSLSIESWLREPKVAKGLSDITNRALQSTFGSNAAYGAGYIQETIQGLVGQAKKAIIVKSADVLYANVLSNSALLIGMGMSPSDVIHHYKEAVPETQRYQRDTEEAFAIDMQISAMSHGERFTNGKVLQQRRAQLIDSLARNPMHELMEAGAYVNIATQMGVSTSQIQDDPEWIAKIKGARGEYLSKTVNDAINEIALTEDSKLYKTAVVGAQMTDFAARYALVRHLTTKGVKNEATGKTRRYTHAEAIDSAMDVFVDFAGAHSPELQLAEGLGFTQFATYRLRVANSLMAAGDINPKGVLGLSILDMALKVSDITSGITVATGSMGMLGLAKSVTTPIDVISNIADNTLLSYAKRIID